MLNIPTDKYVKEGRKVLPFMKERGELDFVTARSGPDAFCDSPLPCKAGLTIRLKTCTVPLSLVTDSHWAVEENAKL